MFAKKKTEMFLKEGFPFLFYQAGFNLGTEL
jgi:hypothetical protein